MTDLTSAPCVRAVEVPQACLAALGSSGGSAVASTGIADGYCDHVLNFEKCNWDGGDCCPSTCSCLADNDNDCDCAPSPCEDEDGFSCKGAHADGGLPFCACFCLAVRLTTVLVLEQLVYLAMPNMRLCHV